MSSPQWHGKYRAIVTDIDDPEGRGRIRVKCPKVLGDSKSHWCEVCSPVAYDNGGDFCLPKKDDTVWVEFEGGDPDKPVYSGSWWSSNNCVADKDKDEYNENTRIIEFDGCKIKMKSDESIEVTIKNSKIFMEEDNTTVSVGDSTEVKVTDDTIKIDCSSAVITVKTDGTIEIQGNSSVSVKSSGSLSLQGASVDIKSPTTIDGVPFLLHTHNCTAPGSPSGPVIPV